MGKYKKLISNTAILGIGTFSSKILVYLLMRFYTEYLTTGQFSSADLITQSANLLMPLAACGIVESIFRFTLDKAENGKKSVVFSTGVNILLISSAVFLLLSPLLYLADSFFGGYTWMIIVYVLSANLHSAVAQYLRAKGETVTFALQGLINTALVIGFNILFLAGFRMGVVGYVLSIIVSDAIVTVILIVSRKLWREYSVRIFDKGVAKDLLKYSLPMIPTTIFWWITSVSDRFMIIGMLEGVLGAEGAKSVNGIYSAAQKIPTIITLLTSIFMEAWHFSAVTETEDGKNDVEAARADFFTEVFKSFSGLLFLACGGIILLSELLTRLMVSADYYDSWRFIPILVIATTFSGLCSFMASVYVVEKKSMLSLFTSMAGAISNLIMNILLIPEFGAMGAAVATMISYAIVFVIRTVNARAYVKFKINFAVLLLDIALVSVSAIFMTLILPYRYLVTLASLAIMLAVNGRPIIKAVLGILRSRLGRGRK